MAGEDRLEWSEILVSLETSLVVGSDTDADSDDNYVRKHSGPIRLKAADGSGLVEIGRIEVWYFDGSRAADNGLDIVELCDEMGEAEYDYARAVYTDGSVDASIIEDPPYSDVLVIRELALEPKYLELGIEARIIRKIGDTLGYHCAAVVFEPGRVGITEEDDIEWVPSKSPLLVCRTDL